MLIGNTANNNNKKSPVGYCGTEDILRNSSCWILGSNRFKMRIFCTLNVPTEENQRLKEGDAPRPPHRYTLHASFVCLPHAFGH